MTDSTLSIPSPKEGTINYLKMLARKMQRCHPTTVIAHS